MEREPSAPGTGPPVKLCTYCNTPKPLADFVRRTGRSSGAQSRRGACRDCRRQRKAAGSPAEAEAAAAAEAPAPLEPAVHAAPDAPAAPPKRKRKKRRRKKAGLPAAPEQLGAEAPAAVPGGTTAPGGGADAADAAEAAPADPAAPDAPAAPPKRKRKKRRRRKKAAVPATPEQLAAEALAERKPKRIVRRQLPAPPPKPAGPDASVLVPNHEGIIWMRGRTDKGRRWRQETDLETAVTLVRERAAIVVNRRTINRIYSNKSFRSYILTRDKYTCYFCGEYGDTIDHIVPRAKGGHTTPMNCVTACHECNQSKAALDLDEFIGRHPTDPQPQ